MRYLGKGEVEFALIVLKGLKALVVGRWGLGDGIKQLETLTPEKEIGAFWSESGMLAETGQ